MRKDQIVMAETNPRRHDYIPYSYLVIVLLVWPSNTSAVAEKQALQAGAQDCKRKLGRMGGLWHGGKGRRGAHGQAGLWGCDSSCRHGSCGQHHGQYAQQNASAAACQRLLLGPVCNMHDAIFESQPSFKCQVATVSQVPGIHCCPVTTRRILKKPFFNGWKAEYLDMAAASCGEEYSAKAIVQHANRLYCLSKL